MALTDSPYNNPFPFMSDEQESPHPIRYMPLPTADTLKNKSLFGIPLRSTLTNQTMSDDVLNQYIQQAVSELEHSLNIFITPVSFSERHDYDREIWTQQNAWLKMNNSPILNVQSVQLSFGNGVPLPPVISFPMEFVYVNGQEGAIRLVPVLGTPTAGFVLSSFAGAQFSALMAAGIFQFPGAVLVEYRAGFDIDKVPGLISGLIEKKAAFLVLSTLGPILFPYNSVSIGIDGTSQGTSNAGVNFLTVRLQQLAQQIEQDMDAARSYYCKRLLIDYI
jgi:hypothetical protein